MMKEKNDTRKDIDTYTSLVHDVMFTQISEKKCNQTVCIISSSAILKEYQKLNNGPMPGNPVLGPIKNEELSGEDRKKELEAVNLIKKRIWKYQGDNMCKWESIERVFKGG